MNNQSILPERMVENLLHTMSTDKKPYPQGLLEVRRAAYLSQVTSLAVSGLHSGKGKKMKGRGQGSAAHVAAPMTPVMKAVLAVLIAGNIALASYLGVLVYENWDKVQALLLAFRLPVKLLQRRLICPPNHPPRTLRPKSSQRLRALTFLVRHLNLTPLWERSLNRPMANRSTSQK